MANYVKATNFYTKDALLTGNPAKIIKGSEIDDEFNAIATAITSKADTTSPTFTGTPIAPTATAGNNSTQIATTAYVATAVGTPGTMAAQNANAVAITGGTVAATFTGNLTGNTAGVHTGAVTGNVTGTVSGNAGTVTNGVYTTDFTKSLSSSGYQKLPGGLIIQWGTNTAPTDSTSAAINYPIAFTTAVFSIVGQKQTPNPGAVSSAVAGALPYSLSQFQVFSEDISVNVSWIAIGY
jgi:hypothetical protein